MSSIKNHFFHFLPASWVERYFLQRKLEIIFSAEPLANVWIKMGVNWDNELWKQRLSTKEGHEPEICRWFQQHLRDEDVVYDIGSAHGFFPILINQLNKNVEIHCFQPRNFNSLFLKFNARRARKINSWNVNEMYVGDTEKRGQVVLDIYAKENQPPTIIKMDIDGPEVFALKGCSSLIDQRKTNFLVEVHPHLMKEFSHSWDDIHALIPDDYVVKYLADVREGGVWSNDFKSIEKDPNPFIYFAPKEIARI